MTSFMALTTVRIKLTHIGRGPAEREAAIVDRGVRFEDNQDGWTGRRKCWGVGCAVQMEDRRVFCRTVVHCHVVFRAAVSSDCSSTLFIVTDIDYKHIALVTHRRFCTLHNAKYTRLHRSHVFMKYAQLFLLSHFRVLHFQVARLQV